MTPSSTGHKEIEMKDFFKNDDIKMATILGPVLCTALILLALTIKSCAIEAACMKACDSLNPDHVTIECIQECKK